MWQIVLSNVSVQGRVVHSNVYGFFDDSSHVVSLPTHNSKVVHCCYMATVILIIEIGDGSFTYYLYLSPNILDDSPMYFLSQPILSHLYQ